MTRVLIISDVRLYREGLAYVLGRVDAVEIAGAFDTLEQSVQRQPADGTGPEVVLLDTASPDALENIRDVGVAYPGVKVVALGVTRQDSDVIACAEAGIAGYVFRDATIEELVESVQSAARGELHCSPRMAAVLLRRVANLARGAVIAPATGVPGDASATTVTRREREILELVDRGYSNKQIGAQLFIEVTTVKNHIHNILEKLGVRTRAEAAAKMRQARLAEARI